MCFLGADQGRGHWQPADLRRSVIPINERGAAASYHESMRLVTFVLLALASTPLFAAPRTCPSVAGSAAIVKPGARLIFGEMHGSNETQKLVGDIACSASALGPLRIGLEIPQNEQARIDAFLASQGTAADRKALTGGTFWTRDFQDGRSSVAMLALIDSARALARHGADVKVVAFDVADAATGDRDERMAKALAAAFTAETNATFVVLVGNLHARKAPHPQLKQTFMAQYLVRMKQPVITLNGVYSLGSAWVCTPTCGPHAIGHGPASARALTLRASSDGAYDGTFVVAPTFSMPAAVSPTAEHKHRMELVVLEIEAQRALEDKQYARCGEVNAELARRDAEHTVDHRYNAACCYALGGDSANAFIELEASVDAGYKDRAWAEKDTDLASLHDDARWAPLVARIPATPTKNP